MCQGGDKENSQKKKKLLEIHIKRENHKKNKKSLNKGFKRECWKLNLWLNTQREGEIKREEEVEEKKLAKQEKNKQE